MNKVLIKLAEIIESANQYEEILVPRLVNILKQGRLPTKEELEENEVQVQSKRL